MKTSRMLECYCRINATADDAATAWSIPQSTFLLRLSDKACRDMQSNTLALLPSEQRQASSRTCRHDEPNGGSHQERLKRGAIKIHRINLKAGCSSNRQDKVNEAEAADLIGGVDAGQLGPGASGEQGLDCRRVPAHSCVVQRCAAILMRGGGVEMRVACVGEMDDGDECGVATVLPALLSLVP